MLLGLRVVRRFSVWLTATETCSRSLNFVRDRLGWLASEVTDNKIVELLSQTETIW